MDTQSFTPRRVNGVLSLPTSPILQIARAAATIADVDFLCFGESDQASPASAVAALTAALAHGDTRYPDVRGQPPLRTALAEYLTGLHHRPVMESRIQLAASGMAAITIALAAVVESGETVMVHLPGWPNITNAVALRGAAIRMVTLAPQGDGSFRLDLDEIAQRIQGCRAFILNSPNNPTGWTATEDELRCILRLCRAHGTWLISDEVYSRLIYGAMAAPSLLDIAAPDDRVIVCNSFSKAWAMTGWRLGWLVVPEGLRDPIANLVEVIHSGVPPFSQQGALAAIRDVTFVSQFRRFCADGRAMMDDALCGIDGVRYASPPAAFYAFIGVDGLQDSVALALGLLQRYSVAVAPGRAFGEPGEGFLRLCFAQQPKRLERALERLRAGLIDLRPVGQPVALPG